jgi:nicotinamide mononucleotide (NMN) deamidase PncC
MLLIRCAIWARSRSVRSPASLLTDVPGCSHAFERGFVVYTEDAKIEMLGVPPEFLPHGGAVSQPTAIASSACCGVCVAA